MLLQQFFTSENTVVFDSKTSNLEDSNFSNISYRSTYPVSNFIPNTYSPSLSPASTISSEWSTATTASPGYIAPPPPYTTAVANLNQEKRRFSGGLEVHTDFQTSTSGPQRAPSGSGTSSSSSVFFSPYSQAASSCSTIRRESLDYSSDSFPSSKNFSDWKLGICNSELSSSLENIPMDDLLTPSPHASPYNFESVSEEEHSQHEQAPPPAPQRQQQPQSAGQFQQQRVGQPSSASTSSQSQHNRQSPSVAPPQQPPRQSRPHQSSEMFGSSLASHHQIPHNTPALNAVPPQFRQLHHSHSTSEILVNPHVQQQVQPRRNDQIDHELLDLIDRIVSENRGESTDPLEARQAPLAIVSTESVAGTSTTPHTSQAGSIEPPQLMEDKASTSGQQPSLQNPSYPFGQLNLRQIKEEIENSQAIHSSLQLPANPSSIAELSAEMQQYLRSAQQQMPSYQAPMLFGPGFNFTQAGSVQQPSTMEQFMQPQSFKTHPFGSSAATATVLATATPFDYSPLFGTSTSGGNTISSFYQQQGQGGSSGIGLPSAGSHLVTTSLDSRRGSHGTTSSGSTNSHTGTPSPLSHNNPHHSAGSVFAAASSFRSCFDSNPFSLVHGANLMHIAGAGSSDMPSSSGLQMQTSIVTSSSSACDDQKLCAVCNDHAICQHYGARTCEGCKGFFKRTVQKKAQYVCAGNKNCPIDKRYRSRCQYCRFQKCIAVGMVKEVVRYGVLSGRRGRLPSKAKTSAGSQLNDQPPSPPLPILTIIAKAFADTRSNNPLMTTSDKNFTVSEMMEILEAEIMSIFNFIQKIPDMVDIKSDQQTLLWWSFFPLFALKQAYCITELNLVEATFIFENGQVAKLSSIPVEFRNLFEEIHKVAQQFRNLVEWDLASFTALLVLQYLGVSEEGPRPNLVDQHSVDRLHSTIINALKDHCCNVATPQPSKLAKIVAQVSQFSNFRTLGVLCLELVRKSGQKLRDLLAEIYHSCYDVREAVGESSADQEGQSQVGQTGSVADQADLPASSGTTAEKVGFRLPF